MDTDSGYMTGKSSANYDMRSQYSTKTSSTRTTSSCVNVKGHSSTQNGVGLVNGETGGTHHRTHHSRHRSSSSKNSGDALYSGTADHIRSVPSLSTSTFHPHIGPNGGMDISFNRTEGSAFEVYKKPSDNELIYDQQYPSRSTSHMHYPQGGLPPPPPPPPPPLMPPPIPSHESK